jgi:hypothetical protein
VDPAGEAVWEKMPKADAIFITHERHAAVAGSLQGLHAASGPGAPD